MATLIGQDGEIMSTAGRDQLGTERAVNGVDFDDPRPGRTEVNKLHR
jgi:hypothetical protein